MLALSKVSPEFNGLALRQVEPREPGPGEMFLRLNAAGVCGTDVSIFKWAPWYANRLTLPRVLGHEASAAVVQVGAGVTNVKPGDHVSLESHIFCGQCHHCRTGRAHVCPNTRYPGTDVD